MKLIITDQEKELTDKLFLYAADTVGVTVQMLLGLSRDDTCVLGRSLVFDELRKRGYSWEKIARLSCRSHSTVMHNVRTLQNDISLYNATRVVYFEFHLKLDRYGIDELADNIKIQGDIDNI